MGYNVDVDPPLYQSKYTSFDKHTSGRMQYIRNTQGNYVKKLGKETEQPKIGEQMDNVPEPLA